MSDIHANMESDFGRTMAYNRTTWIKGDVITADKLNNIESGIVSISTDLAALTQRVAALEAASSGGGTKALSSLSSPTISGFTTQGGVLTVTNGSWNVTPDTYSYQWRRGSNAISGATNATYTLVAADANQVISALVVANKSGYTSASAVSNSITADSAGGTVTPITSIDNGNGTYTLSGTAVTDNNNGTFTASDSSVTDNGNGTFTVAA